MKKGFLRFVAVIMVVLMTAVYFPAAEIDSIFGVEASALKYTYSISGSSAKWTYDTSNKTLTISGSGKVPDYSDTPDFFAKYNAALVVTVRKNARKIVINNGITSIGNSFFKNFEDVTSVSIPASVTSIGNDAFRDCTSIESISVPSSVKTIGSGAFRGCTRLKNFALPSGVTAINANTFDGCSSLASVSGISAVKTIGNEAFKGCTALRSFTIPSAVTVINAGAFQNCTALVSCAIHEGITSIGANAFSNTKLTNIDMPYSVKTIGSNAFSGISGLNIICNYGDATYKYCTSNSVAYSIRPASFKVDIKDSAVNSNQVVVSLYIKDASGFNAGNFKAVYNDAVTPVTTSNILAQGEYEISEVNFVENNTILLGIADAKQLEYSECGAECSYKIAEFTFEKAPKTHVVKIDVTSTVYMSNGTKYDIAPLTEEFGEHRWVANGEEVKPTCEADGYIPQICADCDETRNYINSSALGHAYDNSVVTEPTCESDGYTTISCSRCSDSYQTNIIESEGHITDTVEEPANCISGHKKLISCTVCGASTVFSDNDEIDPNNHVNTKITDAKAETCLENGFSGNVYCLDCEQLVSEGKVIPATGHSTTVVPGKAATCTATGLTDGKVCSKCGVVEVAQTVIPAKGHSYTKTVTKPTCTEKGYTTYKCACGDTYKDNYVNATGHTPVVVPGKPATKTESGLTDGEKCSVCGTILKAQDILPSFNDHEHVDVLESVVKSTCTKRGYTVYRCTYCNRTENRNSTPVIAHQYVSGKCKVCGKVSTGTSTETTTKPSGGSSSSTTSKVEFKDKNAFVVNDTAKTVLSKNSISAADFVKATSSAGLTITDATGKKLADNANVTTGCIVKNSSGAVLYTVSVLGDVNADGKLSAADARAALRISAKLEAGSDPVLLAANCDGKDKVTAADARTILRVSAKLDSFK